VSERSSYNFPNPLTQQPVNISSSGLQVLIQGAPGKQIKVFRGKLLCAGAVNLTILDGASTTLDGPLPFSANEGMILDFIGYDMPPWYTTSPGNSPMINLSAGVQVGGNLDYLLS
jgi:hypothetical protein